jgi:hypothetical protein
MLEADSARPRAGPFLVGLRSATGDSRISMRSRLPSFGGRAADNEGMKSSEASDCAATSVAAGHPLRRPARAST